MAPTLGRRFHVGLTFEPPEVYFLPVGGYKWVVEREIRFRLPSIDHCVSNFFFPSFPTSYQFLLGLFFLFFFLTIKLKATHIENGIPQAPKTDDPFFFRVCVCLYIPLWRIAGRPTYSVI